MNFYESGQGNGVIFRESKFQEGYRVGAPKKGQQSVALIIKGKYSKENDDNNMKMMKNGMDDDGGGMKCNGRMGRMRRKNW